jgi:hypothetical protein
LFSKNNQLSIVTTRHRFSAIKLSKNSENKYQFKSYQKSSNELRTNVFIDTDRYNETYIRCHGFSTNRKGIPGLYIRIEIASQNKNDKKPLDKNNDTMQNICISKRRFYNTKNQGGTGIKLKTLTTKTYNTIIKT